MRHKKKQRQEELKKTIDDNPFVTDDALAKKFNVSVQTIRLDRMELAIPEHRERIKHVAEQQLDDVKALPIDEVIGEIVDLQLDESALSILDIREEHVFSRTGIARGHHLFAQANSLAVAIINDDLALTKEVTIRFSRPVKTNERVIAKAKVVSHDKDDRTTVEVDSYVGNQKVFSGIFQMYRAKGKDE